MAFDIIRQDRRRLTEQDTNDPMEQPRSWECFQCVNNRINMQKMNKQEPRFICVILDVENRRLVIENEGIINPTLKKPLKHCPYHPEFNPEEEVDRY